HSNNEMNPMPAASLVALASALTLATVALTSCGGGGLGPSAPDDAPSVSQPPPVNMSGRWLLSSPDRGQCYMNFGLAPGGSGDGTIAPEGGYPGKFFTSRKWLFQQD